MSRRSCEWRLRLACRCRSKHPLHSLNLPPPACARFHKSLRGPGRARENLRLSLSRENRRRKEIDNPRLRFHHRAALASCKKRNKQSSESGEARQPAWSCPTRWRRNDKENSVTAELFTQDFGLAPESFPAPPCRRRRAVK